MSRRRLGQCAQAGTFREVTPSTALREEDQGRRAMPELRLDGRIVHCRWSGCDSGTLSRTPEPQGPLIHTVSHTSDATRPARSDAQPLVRRDKLEFPHSLAGRELIKNVAITIRNQHKIEVRDGRLRHTDVAIEVANEGPVR